MYGQAYFEWQQAEDIVAVLLHSMNEVEPEVRALVECKLQRRYGVILPKEHLPITDALILQQQQSFNQPRRNSSFGNLFGGF